MEVARNLKIFCLVLLAMVQSSCAGDFGSFKRCILDRGVVSGMIVHRSPNSKKYHQLNFHWQLKPPNIRPLAYIVVTSENDVVTSVICGKKTDVRVVARAGGHSFEKYSFGDSDSVVLDLRNLRSIVPDIDNSSVVIGSGVLAGPVMMTLWNSARSFFPVGTCPTVGISGLATGGGYGFTSRQYGLTTDYIQSMRIVTADGRSLVVNQNFNSDLYWALRGGGAASFGVITSLTMKLVPAPPKFFTATVSWTLDLFPLVFKSWQTFTTDGPRTLTAKLNIYNNRFFIVFVDSTGTDSNFEQVMNSFPVVTSISREYLNFPDYLITIAGDDLKRRKNGATIDPQELLTVERTSAPQTYQIEKSFFVQKIASDGDILLMATFIRQVPNDLHISFGAFGGGINDIDIHDTAFVHRSGRLALAAIKYSNIPRNKLESSNIYFWEQKFFELGAKIFDQKESYQNYVDAQLSSDYYLERYYGSNLQRLVRIKKKYDPDNYFHNPQSIPTRI